MKRILFVISLFLTFISGYAQSDTCFWFAAPDLTAGHDLGISYSEYIFVGLATYNSPAAVTISQPANPAFTPITITIPANSSENYNLSNFLSQLETQPINTALNYGLKITSTSQISAYYEIRGNNSEVYALKGNNALGTQFMIPMQKTLPNSGNFNPLARNSIEIVATEDNTTITITPSVNLAGNHPAGVPFTITLNMGQTYCVASSSMTADQHMGGTEVTSNKPIAISVTDDSVASDYYGGSYTTGQDLVGDQLIPESLAGTHYIAVNHNTTNYASLAVYALEDNTTITFNTNGTITTTPVLNRGDSYNHILGSQVICDVNATKPVLAFLLTGDIGEAGGTILPQADCTGSNSVAYRRSSYSDNLIVTLVVPSTATSNFSVNNSASIITAADFTPVPGNTFWSYCIKNITTSVPINTLLTVVNNTAKFQMGIVDIKNYTSCTVGYFSDYMSNAQLAFKMLNNYCLHDTIAFQYMTNGVSNLRLVQPNGVTLTQEPFIIPSAGPQHTGTYILMAEDTIGCHGGTVMDSIHITVVNVPKPDLGPDLFLCNGAFCTLNPHYPIENVSYQWNDGSTDSTLFVVSMGEYHVRVFASNPEQTLTCSADDTIQVSYWSLPKIEYEADVLDGCVPKAVVIENRTTADSAELTYEWRIYNHETGELVFASIESEPHFTFIEAGVYDVQLVATSANGCVDSLRKNSYLSFYFQPVAEFISNPEISVFTDNHGAIQFTNLSDSTLFDNGATLFTWDFGDGSTEQNVFHPLHEYSTWGDYIVTLTIESEGGCKDQISHYVIIEDNLIFPNIITPNGDNSNDVFAIGNLNTMLNEEDPDEFRTNHLIIYDRWGRVVYNVKNYDTYAKDGQVIVGSQFFDGSGLSDGVYYFTFYYKGKAVERKEYHGTLTIIR